MKNRKSVQGKAPIYLTGYVRLSNTREGTQQLTSSTPSHGSPLPSGDVPWGSQALPRPSPVPSRGRRGEQPPSSPLQTLLSTQGLRGEVGVPLPLFLSRHQIFTSLPRLSLLRFAFFAFLPLPHPTFPFLWHPSYTLRFSYASSLDVLLSFPKLNHRSVFALPVFNYSQFFTHKGPCSVSDETCSSP